MTAARRLPAILAVACYSSLMGEGEADEKIH